MDSFSGKFDYIDEQGKVVQSDACRLNIDGGSLILVPEKGRPLAMDLGDVDVFSTGDVELSLKLYTGKTVSLHHFARAFEDMGSALKGAYRGRLLECLLLEDLEEIERFEAVVQLDSVDDSLKPYFDILMEKKVSGCDYYAGFKMIRPESGAEPGAGIVPGVEKESPAPGEDGGMVETTETAFQVNDDREQALHWFFFPLRSKPVPGTPADVLAWEAASHTGRATYFFRIKPDEEATGDIVDSIVERLNRALVMINFRREPIYLAADALLSHAGYRHYAIAARRLSVLRELRSSYIGRAVHTTSEAWQKQMDAVLDRV